MNGIIVSTATLTYTLIVGLAMHSSSALGQEKTLFSTSFEGIASGAFTEGKIDDVAVTATGTAGISTKFSHTGKQCLHLLGDADNSVTFKLPEDAQSLRGISFIGSESKSVE